MSEQGWELKAEVAALRRRMDQMERKYANEIWEVERKHEVQSEILLRMMDNISASNAQLKRFREEMEAMKTTVAQSGRKTTEIKVKEEKAIHGEVEPERKKSINSAKKVVFHLQNSPKFPQITCFDLSLQNGHSSPTFSWKISEITSKLKQDSFAIESEAFAWTGYPAIYAQATLGMKEDGDVYVAMRLLSEEEDDGEKEPEVTLIPSVYYVLRAQSGNLKHLSRVANYLFPSKFHRKLTFRRVLAHKAWLTHQLLYNQFDSVVIEVFVEPPSTAHMVFSYDGSLSWEVDHWSRRKRMAEKELVWYHESPYFYSGSSGYRLKVRMWLDGSRDFRGKGLTAEVCFLTGEFDDQLPSAFAHRTTVTLLNRKDQALNIVKTVERDIKDNRDYFVDICDDGQIENVLLNDMVFYTVTIEPSS